MSQETDQQLFFIDTGKKPEDSIPTHSDCAWVDEDDAEIKVDLSKTAKLRGLKDHIDEQSIDGIEYAKRLKQRHDLLHARPKWAAGPSTEATVASILSRPYELAAEESKTRLLPDIIEIQRLSNANYQSPGKEGVISCQFHPSAPIVVVADRDSSLKFFTIDDKENPLLHSVQLPGLKTCHAKFSHDGKAIVATGKSRFVYIYDVLEDKVEKINHIPERNEKEWSKFTLSPSADLFALHGDEGHVVLLSSLSKRPLGVLKMNGSVAASTFSPDGKYLLTAGDEHLIYIWDMKTKRCIRSSLGIVNIYSFTNLMESSLDKVKPWKTLMNLTTAIHGLNWHPSSEMFAMFSSESAGAFRLVHMPSGHVYSNWPNSQMNIGLVKSVSFSIDGAMMALGCADGKCPLFALKHYRK